MDEITPTTSTAPNTFTLFPLLPTELRLAIWQASCHSRILEIHYCPSQDRCFTPSKPPVILSVCRESRHEALSRIYAKAFGTRTHPSGSIYFAPDLDILYIPRYYEEEGDFHRHHQKRKAARGEEEKERTRRIMSMGYSETARDFDRYVLNTTELVKNLAIDHVRPEIRRPWETYSKFCLIRSFPRLERAFLILDNTTATTSSATTTAAATITISTGDNRVVEEGVEDGEDDEDQIEFIDPTESMEEITRLMENVSASFSHEVGVGVTTRFEESGSGRGSDDHRAQQPRLDCCLNHASGGHGGDDLALIPKTKVHHHHPSHHAPWQSHTSSFVACA
ncbi:uncharacterized protein B0T23DRAFT_243799 [Neurospora hispaniola]|uniref:2EXR domain-containing protein n=1 Tax=Neurospora hispaniola TaxID=588809 RepID=A0AAJ0HZP1_9PEZI|nr:hypothetical protein B0T23DRAFT_243799 [Neurospora hispaniola]